MKCHSPKIEIKTDTRK